MQKNPPKKQPTTKIHPLAQILFSDPKERLPLTSMGLGSGPQKTDCQKKNKKKYWVH